MPSSGTSWVHDLLVDHSSSRYSMNYDRGQFNHMSHGIVALYRLGASKDRVEQFIDWYAKILEPPYSREEKDDDDSPSEISSWLGKTGRYYALHKHYDSMLKTKYQSAESMIAEEFPKLQLGLTGVALHGLIQVGYALAIRAPEIMCEGIAYMHCSYMPINLADESKYSIEELGSGHEDILDVLQQVTEDQQLLEKLSEAANKWKSIRLSEFGRRIRGLFDMPGDDVMEYVYKIRFPDFFDPKSDSIEHALELCDWIIDCAITVYAKAARRNDFFLLHGVTAAWSLRQVLPLLQDYKMALSALRTFLFALLAVYLGVSAPSLNQEICPQTASDEMAWQAIISSALDEDRDEHVYKLIQVCHDRWAENPLSGALYACASNVCLSHPLAFEELKP